MIDDKSIDDIAAVIYKNLIDYMRATAKELRVDYDAHVIHKSIITALANTLSSCIEAGLSSTEERLDLTNVLFESIKASFQRSAVND
jgi:hypothetical protein